MTLVERRAAFILASVFQEGARGQEMMDPNVPNV